MMKIGTRIAAAIAAALVLCGAALASCEKKPQTDAVMTLGDHAISEGTYRFLYATYKARYLARYADARDVGAFWETERGDGTTNAEWMDALVRDSVRMYLCASYLFDADGAKLDDETGRRIDDYISDIVNERFDGDEECFGATLGAYGIDRAAYRDILLGEEKMTALFDRYFGTDGTRQITDAERRTFFRENYVHFAQINVNDAYAYVERDGEYVEDQSGEYETRELTDAEREAKAATVAEIDAALAAGETVSSLYAEYSENTDYPGGYYFSRLSASDYDEEIVSAAFALAEGEFVKLHTKHGTFWIERLSLDAGAFADSANADFFGGFESALKDSLFDALLRSKFDGIAEDADRVNALSVTSVPAASDLD